MLKPIRYWACFERDSKGKPIEGESGGNVKACSELIKAQKSHNESRWKPKGRFEFTMAKIEKWKESFQRKDSKKPVLQYSSAGELEDRKIKPFPLFYRRLRKSNQAHAVSVEPGDDRKSEEFFSEEGMLESEGDNYFLSQGGHSSEGESGSHSVSSFRSTDEEEEALN
ncbi:hypothetical protein L484_006698 [Morus notabilis]|uniref:Uncharacterized protein n=1 Tax=Morus notabilis TaxID=981085 RepID=W9SB83_9ROSA|nr:hypothetical protein L484_006698 [Morus notabilis]